MGAVWLEIAAREGADVHIAVIASGFIPTQQSELLSLGLKSLGLSCEVMALDVAPSEFEGCIRHLSSHGYNGASVLGIHRSTAAHIGEKFYLSRHSMGVANALRLGEPIYALNTEVVAIQRQLEGLEPKKALVLGAGNAARSTIVALFELGWKVKIWNRSSIKIRPMQTLFARYGELELAHQPDPTDCKLIVNCTPLGAKAGEEPPLLWRHVQARSVCMDLVYRRVSTEFLRSAAMRGLKAIDGREIYAEQAALSIEWWVDKQVDREPLRLAMGLRPQAHSGL